ncbi:MAG: HlyD family secretion protein [Amaricoccus sp.]|uniref:HlyD family secretion protein n=1 Tax=Amaricoccus sp. TaxID=1872485 RepID=UPI0039E672DE
MNAQPSLDDFKALDLPPARPSRLRRNLLIAAVPLALALGGGYVWVTGGRYVATDDAYVKQDRVTVMPQVSGQIASVSVAENQTVKAGDPLFTIDDSAYRATVAADEARLQSARLDVEKLKAAYAQAVSEASTARDALATAETQDERVQSLRKSGVVAQSDADTSALALQQARGAVAAADSQVLSAKAALAGNPEIPTDSHPEVLEAQAALNVAQLNLAHTVVTAPQDGVATQTSRLLKGQYVTPSTAVVALMATGNTWIEANFKETDLEHMLDGQPVSVRFDGYPGRSFEGRLELIGAGTGSEFALIPAQNASGNWVKVVQRVPVRVDLAGADLPPVRAGMSASVDVDTGRSRGLPAPVGRALAAIGIGGSPAAAAGQDAK